MRENEVDVTPQADDETDGTQPVGSQEQDAKVESVQDVTDRVRSYHDGAPVDTVRAELTSALAKAGLQLPDDEVLRIAQGISDGAVVDVEQAD